MNSFVRKTRKILTAAILAIVFLLLGILVLSQTDMARRLVLNEVESVLNSSTNAKLSVDKIDGNLITGFVLTNVHLRLHTGTAYDTSDLLSAKRVIARYSLIRFLRTNELAVSSILLDHPVFEMLRFTGDTVWNISRFLKSAPTTKAKSKFNTTIDLASFRIADGTFIVKDFNLDDSTASPIPVGLESPDHVRRVHWHNIALKNITMDSHVFVRGEEAQSIRIDDLSCIETNSGFRINRFELSAYHDSLQTRLDLGRLTTPHSVVDFAADLAPAAFLRGAPMAAMKNADARLVLSAPVVNIDELTALIPAMKFMAGTVGLELQASGTYGDLQIERCDVRMKNEGTVALNGTLKHLEAPSDLAMDFNLTGKQLSDGTLRYYFPGLYLPDLSKAGTIEVHSLHYVGGTKAFTANFDITSSHGSAKGSGAMDFRTHVPSYRFDGTTSHIDLGGFTGKPALASDLNVEVKIQGSGFNYRTASAVATVAVTAPSTMNEYRVVSLDGTAAIRNGLLWTNHFEAALDGGTAISLDSVRFAITSSTKEYSVKGNLTNVPVSRYVRAFHGTQARLSADLDINGKGLDINALSGTADLRLSNLIVKKERFNDVVASLHISPAGRDTGNSIQITSDLADLGLAGTFGIEDFTTVIPQRLAALDSAIVTNQAFPSEEHKAVSLHEPEKNSTFRNRLDSVDVRFSLRVKDLRPLTALMPNLMLLASGQISGTVKGTTTGELNLSTQGSIGSFIMRYRKFEPDTTEPATSDPDTSGVNLSGIPRIQLTPSKFDFSLDHLDANPRNLLERISMGFSFASDSALRYNNLLLFDPHVRLKYEHNVLSYRALTILAEKYGIHLLGSAAIPIAQPLTNQSLTFGIDSLTVFANRTYRWTAEKKSAITVTPTGVIRLDTIDLTHKEVGDLRGTFAEHFEIAAEVDRDSIRYASIKSSNLRLTALSELMASPGSHDRFASLQGHVERFEASMSGTLEHPDATSRLRITKLKYGGLAFDSASAQLNYDHQTLSGDLTMHVDSVQFAEENAGDVHALAGLSSNNQLHIRIDSIPFLFAFKHDSSYAADSIRVRTRLMAATLDASHFPIDIAALFLPSIDDLGGFGDVSMALRGTENNMKLSGSATISEGTFRVLATNLYYSLDGRLLFADQVLTLDSLHLRNSPDDDPAGSALITGRLKFKNFAIDTFDISAQTRRLTVLNNASRSTLHSIYGPMVIGTMGQPLQFVGSPQNPLLRGSMNIVQSFLTVQSSSDESNSGPATGIIYHPYVAGNKPLMPDTSLSTAAALGLLKSVADSALMDSLLFPQTAQDIYSEETQQKTIDSAALQAASTEQTNNLMDRLRYDLRIDITGDAMLIVPMEQLSGLLGEELRGDLRTQTPLHIERGEDHKYRITGTLELTENSSYSFYKTFSPATGTITFHGDPTDAELNITAEYASTHATVSNPNGEVKIRLIITGTEKAPHLTMEIYEAARAGGDFTKREGNQQDIQEDALYYLISGSFKGELSADAQAGVMAKAQTALESSFASSMLNNIFGETIFKNMIRSFNLEYGGSLSASRLNLTAGYRDLVFHFASSGLSSSLDADYSVEVPLSFFMNFNGARSFVFDFDYHPLSTSDYQALQQPNYQAKFLFRIPIR